MYYAYPAEKFQFHKGTIKTFRSYKDRYLQLYFNSIKVRLKQMSLSIKACISSISIP